MKRVVIRDSSPLFTREIDVKQIALGREDYLARIALLRGRMREAGVDTAVVFGDREHFANIEYLSSYDCRFEEGILVIPAEGLPTIVCGNEGMAYSFQIPYEVNRVYYRNFSLQGQPRRAEERLDVLFKALGITQQTKVGVTGFKYFYEEYCMTDPLHTFDLPHYLIEALFAAAGPENVVNFTYALTGLDGGIRLRVYSAKEIAAAEAAAARSTNGLLRMLKALKPGMTEYEVGENAGLGVAPVSMHPLTNFGAEHMSLGLRSPSDDAKLALGDVCGLCYGVRGSLSSRNGVACYDEATMMDDLRPTLYPFYGKFFEAMCAWYGKLRVGATGDELHRAVHDVIGAPEYGVTLNCGHYTGMDEWVNSPTYAGSTHTLPDGAYLQADIIASSPDPVRTAICEDPVIVAGERLRGQLRKEYPEVWARIEERRAAIRGVLGVDLQDDVLPISNLNAAMFPFLLNLKKVFALEDEK